MRSNIIIAGGLLLFAAIVIADRKPVASFSETWVTDHGIVTEMYETAFKDLVLKLKDNSKSYYINGTSELGMTLKQFENKVLYKVVVIQYPERWTPLKNEEGRHYISKLEQEGEVIFNEDE
jgi:hypothetical protein